MQDPITTAEVAEILKMRIRTVQRAAAAGRLPVLSKTSGRRGVYLFDREEIEKRAGGGS